jgi:hypothetical protein
VVFILARPGRSRSFRRTVRSRSGISDVIGTILLLGLTVTLFGTVFLFVNTFPRPPPQPTGQFSAYLTYTVVGGVGQVIATVNIGHLAGATLYNSITTNVWIESAAKPGAFTGPFTVGNGLGGAATWSIGQTWSLNVTSYHLTLPDNLTISIVQSSQLLFRQTLPGSNPSIPPQFTNYGTVPASPVQGTTFSVFVQIADGYLSTSSTAVLLNYSLLPGFSSAAPATMTYSATAGTWGYTVPVSGATAPGTFFVFVTATDSNGLSNSVAIPVTILAPGAASNSPLSVSISLNVSAPVTSAASTIYATVSDTGATGGTATVNFLVNGVSLGTGTGAVSAFGSVIVSSPSWTPSAIGTATVVASASIPGLGTANGTQTMTVFPPILLLAHNTAYTGSGTTKPYTGPADESGWLAAALTADGIPFTMSAVSCKSGIPASSSAVYTGKTVIIVDYGSSSSPGCTNGLSTDATNLGTLAATHSIWVVGSNAWSTSACPSVAAFLTAFGMKTGSGGCGAAVTLPVATAVYSAQTTLGLRADAVPASYTLNKTVAGNSTFVAYTIANAYTSGATGTSYFKVGGTIAGELHVNGAYVEATLGFDPSMLVRALPSSQTWGTGGASAEITYNIVDCLAGITTSTSTSANRQGLDFAVSQVTLVGQSHTAPTLVQTVIRENGAPAGFATVTLLVNGTPAFYEGASVSTTTFSAGNTITSIFITLTWQAPTGGPFTLTVLVSSGGQLYTGNNQFGPNLLGTTTQFY